MEEQPKPELGQAIVLYSSREQRACRERALVLRAKAIPFTLVRREGAFSLLVAAEFRSYALDQLEKYEAERVDWPPTEELPRAAPGYRSGVLVFALFLVLAFLITTGNAGGLDWSAAGRSHAQAVRNGELWRSVTALSLHTGLPHLLSNVIFGALFGFFVAYVHGGGLGWLAIVVAGFLGNLTNAWLRDPSHLSVGASTAVFGAVGIMVGSEWRRRKLLRHDRLRRTAPFLAGILLLGYLGMGQGLEDRHTDISAHVTGLFWGVPIGALLSSIRDELRTRVRVQIAAGLVCGLLVVGTWALALR